MLNITSFSYEAQRNFLIFPEDISYNRNTSQVLNNKAKCAAASSKVPVFEFNLLFDTSIYVTFYIYINFAPRY